MNPKVKPKVQISGKNNQQSPPLPRPMPNPQIRESERERQPIRNFMDLKVYQNAQAITVEVLQQLLPSLKATKGCIDLKKSLRSICMQVPTGIAECYTRRFYNSELAIERILDEIGRCSQAMVVCELISRNFVKEANAGTQKLLSESAQKFFYLRLQLQNMLKLWRSWQHKDSSRQSGSAQFSGPRDQGQTDHRQPQGNTRNNVRFANFGEGQSSQDQADQEGANYFDRASGDRYGKA